MIVSLVVIEERGAVRSGTYVVPVPSTGLERLLGKAKGALPQAGPLASERKLTPVAVPRTDEMGGLDFGAGGKGEG